MNPPIQSVKGMNDLLPEGIGLWHHAEAALRSITAQYGYQEIRTPVLEHTELFRQSIGDQTDIVEKEMYTFDDRGSDSLALRPEATASTVRACIQHGLLHNQQQRLWYMGPMFRRENPQKGRYRQFHQFGVEAFGWQTPEIDSEIIHIGERVWAALGIEGIALQLNTLGSAQSRSKYRDALKTYFHAHFDALDHDSQRRLQHNPLRILDSKNPHTQKIVDSAPVLEEYLASEERLYFDRLCRLLDNSGINYTINPHLVRGLDYYTSIVFEWVSMQLGAQSAICAGGRYDTLVEKRGGRSTAGVGFAMGMERLIELMKIQNNQPELSPLDVYLVNATENQFYVVQVAELLRDAGMRVSQHCGGGKLKNQFKRADASRASYAVVVGDTEVDSGSVQIKPLRASVPQTEVKFEKLKNWAQSAIT